MFVIVKSMIVRVKFMFTAVTTCGYYILKTHWGESILSVAIEEIRYGPIEEISDTEGISLCLESTKSRFRYSQL